jgi:hypothetical protein
VGKAKNFSALRAESLFFFSLPTLPLNRAGAPLPVTQPTDVTVICCIDPPPWIHIITLTSPTLPYNDTTKPCNFHFVAVAQISISSSLKHARQSIPDFPDAVRTIQMFISRKISAIQLLLLSYIYRFQTAYMSGAGRKTGAEVQEIIEAWSGNL